MDDQYKQGLITGLAMHPLYVGTIFKKVNTAYFGFSGNDPDGLCDASSPVGFASAEGTLSEDSVSSILKNGPFVYTSGFTGYYDMTSISPDATSWHNLVRGASDISLVNSVADEREVTIKAGGYGVIENVREPATMYCCFKSSDFTQINYWQGALTKQLKTDKLYNGFDFFIYRSNRYHYFSAIANDIASSVASNKYVLMCATRTKAVDLNNEDSSKTDEENAKDDVIYSPKLTIYLNGLQIYQAIETDETSTHKCQWGNFTGKYYLNVTSRDGSEVSAGCNYPISYKLIAFGNSVHSAEQVKANTESFFTQLREV